MKYQWEVWLTLLLSGSNGMILAKGQVSLIVKADINDAFKMFLVCPQDQLFNRYYGTNNPQLKWCTRVTHM